MNTIGTQSPTSRNHFPFLIKRTSRALILLSLCRRISERSVNILGLGKQLVLWSLQYINILTKSEGQQVNTEPPPTKRDNMTFAP